MNIAKKEKCFVWKKINETEKVITMNLSTYEGEDKEEKAKYSSWLGRFVGKAYKKALALREKDKIELLNAKIENLYDSEKKQSMAVVTIFDFELLQEKKEK